MYQWTDKKILQIINYNSNNIKSKGNDMLLQFIQEKHPSEKS